MPPCKEQPGPAGGNGCLTRFFSNHHAKVAPCLHGSASVTGPCEMFFPRAGLTSRSLAVSRSGPVSRRKVRRARQEGLHVLGCKVLDSGRTATTTLPGPVLSGSQFHRTGTGHCSAADWIPGVSSHRSLLIQHSWLGLLPRNDLEGSCAYRASLV